MTEGKFCNSARGFEDSSVVAFSCGTRDVTSVITIAIPLEGGLHCSAQGRTKRSSQRRNACTRRIYKFTPTVVTYHGFSAAFPNSCFLVCRKTPLPKCILPAFTYGLIMPFLHWPVTSANTLTLLLILKPRKKFTICNSHD